MFFSLISQLNYIMLQILLLQTETHHIIKRKKHYQMKDKKRKYKNKVRHFRSSNLLTAARIETTTADGAWEQRGFRECAQGSSGGGRKTKGFIDFKLGIADSGMCKFGHL